MTIIVNGIHKNDIGPFISFEELVSLAGMKHADTVIYRERRGHGNRGALHRGESVVVTEDMVFDVANTNRA